MLEDGYSSLFLVSQDDLFKTLEFLLILPLQEVEKMCLAHHDLSSVKHMSNWHLSPLYINLYLIRKCSHARITGS